MLVPAVNGVRFVGGLMGSNYGEVTKCYSTGTVSGNSFVGGLMDYNGLGGALTQCYSTSMVGGTENVGGLVGDNNGVLTQCFSTGRVSGNSFIGGFVGSGSSYSEINCFWNIETSGQNTSAGGGTGTTTNEMQSASTFLETGWDFVDETENGTDDFCL